MPSTQRPPLRHFFAPSSDALHMDTSSWQLTPVGGRTMTAWHMGKLAELPNQSQQNLLSNHHGHRVQNLNFREGKRARSVVASRSCMHVTFGVLLSFFLAEPDAIDGINQRQASIAAAQAEAPLVGLAVCLSPFLPSLAPLPLPSCSAPPSVFGIDHTSAAFYSCGCPQPPPFSQHSRLYLSTRGTWAARTPYFSPG